MNNANIKDLSSGQMGGSRFLKSFSSSKSSYSQRGSVQPPLKKPKLDIDKHINLSGSSTSDSSTGFKQNGDLYDDLWGDDPDSTTIEKVIFDETLALSQMPDTLSQPNPEADQYSVVAQSSKHKQVQTNRAREPLFTKGSNEMCGFASNKSTLSNHMRNGPRVPLRRIASSGWPSANSFSPSQANYSSVVNKTNCGKRLTDVNTVQTDLEQLQIENSNLKEILVRKTGEANLIRDRLSSLQQECVKQKDEYLDKISSVKQEAERNIIHLSKEIKSLKAQLEVKAMEIETAERRAQQLNSINKSYRESPNRQARNNVRPAVSPSRVSNKLLGQLTCGGNYLRGKECNFSFDFLKKIITPELLIPSLSEPAIVEAVRTTNVSLFSGPVGGRQDQNEPIAGSSKTMPFTARNSSMNCSATLAAAERELRVPCPSVESCSLALLSSQLMDISSENAHQAITQVLQTCGQILLGNLHQLESAVSQQIRHVEKEKEVHLCGNKYLMLTKEYNLLCSKEQYNNERGICSRRALALLSLLVEISDFAAQQILPSPDQQNHEKNNDDTVHVDQVSAFDCHMMLYTVKSIVSHIKNQRRTHIFEGVLAGAVALSKSLLQADIALSQQSQEVILQIVHAVVFARPGSLVIQHILQVLLASTKYPYIMDSLCCNSDTCTLQVLCTQLQLIETPRKYILSDVFTLWVLTLFYGGQHIPEWLFSVPSQTSCNCRPLISQLTFTLLGEACCVYPSAAESEKPFLEKLLTRGILLVCTLLYHDEHFGANVDPASVGYYELFLHSINTMDFKLNPACREILESLCIQEALRQPVYTSGGDKQEQYDLLNSLRSDERFSKPRDVLELLDNS